MVRAEEQRRVKSDENKEYGSIWVHWAKNAIYDDKGKKQAILKEEREDKFPAGSFGGKKHSGQT